MKKNVLNIIAILIALFGVGFGIGCLISLLSQRGTLADGEYQVTICATTDVHGAYFDSLYVDNMANRTSLSNVSSYMKEVRASGVQPILIDVGDNLQGDIAAYYFNYVATDVPHLMPRIMEYLGYDAVIVGNHDIETGHSVYDRITRELKMPYLAANAAFDRDENGVADMDEDPKSKLVSDAYFLPYCIIDRGNVKVAVIGMTNANIKSWLSESYWNGSSSTRSSPKNVRNWSSLPFIRARAPICPTGKMRRCTWPPRSNMSTWSLTVMTTAPWPRRWRILPAASYCSMKA